MTTVITKKFLNLTTIGSFIVALSVAGCSGKDEATEEPVEADADAEAGTAPESPAPSTPAPSQKVEAVAPESVAAPTPTPSSGSPASTTSFSNSGRRVMYVKTDGAVLRDKPEPKASVVGKLNRGDHILVTIEGDWAKTDDGKFVAMKVLSEKGIGRAKRDASWSGGSSGSASSGPAATKKSGKKLNSAANTKSSEPAKDGASEDSNP